MKMVKAIFDNLKDWSRFRDFFLQTDEFLIFLPRIESFMVIGNVCIESKILIIYTSCGASNPFNIVLTRFQTNLFFLFLNTHFFKENKVREASAFNYVQRNFDGI